MAIEGVVFDVSGTLLETTSAPKPRSTDRPQSGVESMLAELKGMGLQIVAVSNDPAREQFEKSGLTQYIDHVLEKSDVGKGKGSPVWIAHFRSLTGLEANQLFYVGDSERDMVVFSHSLRIAGRKPWLGRQRNPPHLPQTASVVLDIGYRRSARP